MRLPQAFKDARRDADMFQWMPGASPLWIAFRGASARGAVAWGAWVALVGAGAMFARELDVPGAAALTALALGWFCAWWMGTPLDALRRYHLDDDEVIVMGPGTRVRRLAWGDVLSLTQRRDALRLEEIDGTVTIPLGTPEAREAWAAVLTRVVPDLAADVWLRLDDGEERLVPSLDPPTRVLAWWAWLPAAMALVAGHDSPGVVLVVLAAALERGIAWARSHWQTVTLHPTGIALRSRGGRCFVPWGEAVVTPVARGLRVGLVGREGACLATSAPNFWPAAAAMVLRAQVGPLCPGPVTFRVRVDGDGLSVVGEIDAPN